MESPLPEDELKIYHEKTSGTK